MAFTDDVVEQRLSGLNESHDSISTTAQWLMFHRRHADRIVQLWMNRLQDSSSNKRLNLIYLANDVIQKSKIRSRNEFLVSFSPVVAESIALAYKAAPQNIRGKLAHVVGVWRERNIFELPVQAAVEARIQELDRIRNGSQTPAFSAGVPEEVPSKLKPLVAAFQDTSKQTTAATAAVAAAFQDYDKLMDPSNPQQAPPVFAARLNGALNTLTASHATVSGYVKARQGLVAELEALLAASKAELDKDEEKLAQLAQRKDEIFSKKHEVEMEIMRGLDEPAGAGASSTTPTTAAPGADAAAVSASMDAAPEVEALTPPSMHGNDEDEEDEYEPAPEMETLDIVDQEMVAQETVDQETAEPSRKRRRIEADPVPVANDDATDEAFPDLGQDDGIDADVADMLRGGNAT